VSFEINFTPFQQRLSAIALAAIPISLLVMVLFQAIAGWIAHHERMAVLDRQLATYRELIDDQPRRAQQLAEFKAAGVQGAFFAGTSASSAASQIQNSVGQIVKSAGGAVTQSDVRVEAQPDSPVVRIAQHLRITCDIAALTKILHQVERARPSLFVDRLAIDDPGQSTVSSGPHQLDVDLSISSYLRVT
jgi:general secretion pathway protein M